jgi:hypothetical protein
MLPAQSSHPAEDVARQPAQLPTISEPSFQGLKAKLEVVAPVMNLDDLQKGLQQL